MLKAKIIRKCPNCRQSLNPRLRIEKVSCCSFCGWAGSFHSQNYDDWVQFKVSSVIIGMTFLFAYGLFQADKNSNGKMMAKLKSAIEVEQIEETSNQFVQIRR